MHRAPLVSIVMATYNRSNIIGYAIESVRRSTLTDWELIVVGDCCTDDTEAVVNRFNDPRIIFINLPENFGEQSYPNNVGAAKARGEYLAFLNHDDMYLPDHLEKSIAVLEEENAEFVFGVGLRVDSLTHCSLIGAVTQSGIYTPDLLASASLWVMQREVFERVGAMRSAKELRLAPTLDWRIRALRMGIRMVASHHLGTVFIQSGGRKNSYAGRQDIEHVHFARRMQEKDFPARELLDIAIRLECANNAAGFKVLARQWLKNLVRNTLMRLGIWPPGIRYWLRFGRKGAFLKHLREVRGLSGEWSGRSV